MPTEINPYKGFFLAVLFSTFIGYFFNSGILAYGPLIIFVLLIIYSEILTCRPLKKDKLIVILSWLPYSFWASFVYISNPYEGKYLSTHFLSILILPIITLSYFRIFDKRNDLTGYLFTYKAVFLFLLLQLFIALGQISNFVFGIGFPVSEAYADYGMITGTFTNSNDLAAVVLVVLFFVTGLEKNIFKSEKYLFWLVAFTLIVVTGSRSAIILSSFIFIVSKVRDARKLVLYALILFLLIIVLFFIMSNVDNIVLNRFEARLNSILLIFESGIASDNSMIVRLGSYFHFFDNILTLGLGSGKINDYFIYSNGANFNDSELLFRNPHSLVVELGYWLGWPGLLFFFVPFFLMLRYSQRKYLFLLIFLVASMISSSVMGSMIFFLLIILCFHDAQCIDDTRRR